ncbi:MAG: BatD family protein [Candidatus Methanoperedens sp.]|nr:BatD family protein [Candidatus Methanoperedens nitroreducens]MDJ1422215.1 BatD family protein [Candidatus Methanoperedens sp.]
MPASADDGALDTFSVPAFGPRDTGSSVNSSLVLEKGSEYRIVVSGVYQFKVGTDWGYADAQYRMGAGRKYNQPFNSIEFDGERLNADISDVNNHTYTFYLTGSGKKIRFSIYDSYTTGERGEYDNNAGYLKVEIYRLDTISLTKSLSPRSIELGQAATVTITLKNTGTAELKNITVSDPIPAGFTLVSGKPDKNYDVLKPKDTRSFQYIIQPPETGTFNLEPAEVSYYNRDGYPHISKSNNSAVIVVPSDKPVFTQISNASVQLHGEKTDVVLGEDVLLKLSAVNLITKPIMHVQVIILPPSGMSVTSSEFVQSGSGQFTTTYEIPPGKGRNIEVRIRSNQVGEFEVLGRIVYYFDGDSEHSEDYTLRLPINVRANAEQPAPTDTTYRNWIPGFEALLAVIGLLVLYIIKKW